MLVCNELEQMCIRDSYLDDIVIYSESMEQHFKHLREVLSRFKKAGLTVNPKKVNCIT